MVESKKKILLHLSLFVVTFMTTTLAGAEWGFSNYWMIVSGNGVFINPEYTWSDFSSGLAFSISFLLILTTHEFGHYFMAMYHGIKASLPYYIPTPPGFNMFGTLGAVIRIRTQVFSNLQHFDIGLAGPVAGFIVALGILTYGFMNLPEPEYIFQIHPEYEQFGLDYADHVYSPEFMKQQLGEEAEYGLDLYFGSNLLFAFFENVVADPARVPNPREMMHYPFLLAGFLALFFTSLNLLPIGQLDGGHVVYGLFGQKGHRIIASVAFMALLLYSGLGIVDIREEANDLVYYILGGIAFYYLCFMGFRLSPLKTFSYALGMVAFILCMAYFFPAIKGYSGWMLFSVLIGRVLGVHHPISPIEKPLDRRRQVLGWIGLIIFIISFSPQPIIFNEVPLK